MVIDMGIVQIVLLTLFVVGFLDKVASDYKFLNQPYVDLLDKNKGKISFGGFIALLLTVVYLIVLAPFMICVVAVRLIGSFVASIVNTFLGASYLRDLK